MRVFADPAGTYRGLGEVSGSVRLLRQVLDQLSRAHADHRDIVFTDDRAPAETVALAAADELIRPPTCWLRSWGDASA